MPDVHGSQADADNLSRKLQEFHDSLSEGEQEVLVSLIAQAGVATEADEVSGFSFERQTFEYNGGQFMPREQPLQIDYMGGTHMVLPRCW